MDVLTIFQSYSQDWTFSSVSSDETTLDTTQDQRNGGSQSTDRQLHEPESPISGRRRETTDKVQTSFHNPDILRCIDNIEVECPCCGEEPRSRKTVKSEGYDIWNMSEQQGIENMKLASQVVVAVEATALCAMDLEMRNTVAEEEIPLPFILGSNVVGVAHQCSTEAIEEGIKPGTRVASIMKFGANARYVSVPTSNLMVVPKHLDAGDIACLISAYLPAFQALHHGRTRPYRYSRSCLRGRRVLVTGGATLEAQAVIRLAQLAGATEIYVTAPRNHFHILQKRHVNILDSDPDEWLPSVEGRMDIVVDYDFPNHFFAIQASLARKGRLVCSSPSGSGYTGWMRGFGSILEQYLLMSMKRATLFDFVEDFERDTEGLKEDFRFLLRLLSLRQIRPQIDRYIKLRDVSQAYRDIQSVPLTGAIICEPWKE